MLTISFIISFIKHGYSETRKIVCIITFGYLKILPWWVSSQVYITFNIFNYFNDNISLANYGRAKINK